MANIDIQYKETREIPREDILDLYRANRWNCAERPDALYGALMNSETLISAWDGDRLIGLANAISDGHLVVFYPHLLVLPDYQKKGIGISLMARMTDRYKDFHQQVLISEPEAIGFYEKCGFKKTGGCPGMWIYDVAG